MNYTLENTDETKEKTSLIKFLLDMLIFLKGRYVSVTLSFIFVMINSVITIIIPMVISDGINRFVLPRDKDGLLSITLILISLYLLASFASYMQIRIMGGVGQHVLYGLRNSIFEKLQSLPLAFFNQNKSGDLISRINNDTEKLNSAFSETILRFIGNIFILIGIAIIVLIVNFKLGLALLHAAFFLLIITQVISPFIKKANQRSLQKQGELSAETQESLANFKVVVAFNKRKYFRETFNTANENNKKANIISTIANGILVPIYEFGGNFANLVVLLVGISMIQSGEIDIGTLIGFILYIERFYQPLRIIASLFGSIQSASAAWIRIDRLLKLENNLKIINQDNKLINQATSESSNFMILKNVHFSYDTNKNVLEDVSIELEKGKTYALVGPTGGGKSTLASLLARLYDPAEGEILLENRDLKSYSNGELSQKIGFILQDPFMFTGSVLENITYGNSDLRNTTEKELMNILQNNNLDIFLERFPEGLGTMINNSVESISLGQRQLIAFIRAVLRNPEMLILDEATANVDTITEKILQKIISNLPEKTVKVVIAHRLSTIESADQIFFIANGRVERPVDFGSAVNLIQNQKLKS